MDSDSMTVFSLDRFFPFSLKPQIKTVKSDDERKVYAPSNIYDKTRVTGKDILPNKAITPIAVVIISELGICSVIR